MFDPLLEVSPRRRTICLYASIAVHCVLLAYLLHSGNPTFVSPSSIVGGTNGKQVTHLYWEGTAAEAAEEPRQEHLTFESAKKRKKDSSSQPTKLAINNLSDALHEAEPARPAGSPYGSLSEGTLSGYEVRPALPVVTLDPQVDASELPGGFEGNIVVEITIDEQGNVVQEVVTESVAPAVDAKVLAAVRSWHFRPATRDGIAIPSKQDVYYHFPKH